MASPLSSQITSADNLSRAGIDWIVRAATYVVINVKGQVLSYEREHWQSFGPTGREAVNGQLAPFGKAKVALAVSPVWNII